MEFLGLIGLVFAVLAYYRIDKLENELKRKNILAQDFISED